MTQLGHSKLETTQIYAAIGVERRRATVMGMAVGAEEGEKGSGKPRWTAGRRRAA